MLQHVIVGIGEILWDVFLEGLRFGGAPANFACSAARLGGDDVSVFMVSNVGRDDLGQRAVDSLQKHGADVSCVSPVDRPTGQVNVELDHDGHASYTFAADTAWDHLAWSQELEDLAARAAAVCFGTLGQRSDPSRQTIRRFVSSTTPECLRICDINLRPPFYSDSIILESLDLANVLKLNDDELPVVATACGISGSDREMIRQLASRFQLRIVALTRGARGLFDIEAVLEVGEAKTVGIDVRGHRVEYSVAAKELTALGSKAPLEPEDGLIALRILVDRTSVEVFANAGRVQIANCFLPDEENRDLSVYARGGTAKAPSVAVWELRSIWDAR